MVFGTLHWLLCRLVCGSGASKFIKRDSSANSVVRRNGVAAMRSPEEAALVESARPQLPVFEAHDLNAYEPESAIFYFCSYF